MADEQLSLGGVADSNGYLRIPKRIVNERFIGEYGFVKYDSEYKSELNKNDFRFTLFKVSKETKKITPSASLEGFKIDFLETSMETLDIKLEEWALTSILLDTQKEQYDTFVKKYNGELENAITKSKEYRNVNYNARHHIAGINDAWVCIYADIGVKTEYYRGGGGGGSPQSDKTRGGSYYVGRTKEEKNEFKYAFSLIDNTVLLSHIYSIIDSGERWTGHGALDKTEVNGQQEGHINRVIDDSNAQDSGNALSIDKLKKELINASGCRAITGSLPRRVFGGDFDAFIENIYARKNGR